MSLRLLLLLFALLPALPGMAQDTELKTFPLQQRNAQEMIPVLRPLLEPGTTLSGSGYTLIVRGTPQTLREIEHLLAELDRAPRNLMVLLHRGELTTAQRQGTAASGALDSGADGTGIRGQVRVYRTERQGEEQGDQRLRVLEGQWAHLRAGDAIPLPHQSTVLTPGGVVTQQGIEYRDVATGVEVRPRLSGDRVTLEVRPYRARPAATGGGVIESQALITTVSGRLGEWIELGGVAEETSGQDRGILHATERRERTDSRLYIKVELVP